MGLSRAMQWWEDWQLRVLVLSSLFIQLFLYFSDLVRRSPSLRKLRVLVWIAYVGGDALAIYALATLFNRHRQQTVDEGSSILEVVWAPILLIHLGGQPWITAYSLEDNELWKRHAITVVSQVMVALYVFCKWWSGEKRLLQVAVLLFIVGILKFGQKPWALKTASFNSMLASADSSPGEKGLGSVCWALCTANITDIFLTFSNMIAQSRGGEAHSLEKYVQAANSCVLRHTGPSFAEVQSTQLSYIYKMFADMSTTYTHRLHELAALPNLDHSRAYYLLQRDIRYMFQLLYTKIGTTTTLAGMVPLLLFPALVLASMVLFAMSNKDGYNDNDVRVTYILLCCTVLQELLLILSFLCGPCRNAYAGLWHNMVSQNNLMSFCVRKKQPTILMKLATFSCLREYLNKHWYIWQEPEALEITILVRQHVEDGWKKYIRGDTARYRRFNDFRGQRALRRHHQLRWSLSKPFDQSVILWHIATDLCFHSTNTSPTVHTTKSCSRVISNYMIYLLSTHPEMLMPGTSSTLFTIASRDIGSILRNSKEPLNSEENISRGIINMMKQSNTSYSQIKDTCRLAEALIELDENERWTMIQDVWVEMLCYSASKCRGYLHAKSLGEGGEYLTTVWVHWSLMGMETLADRLQRPEPSSLEEDHEEEAGGAAEEDRRSIMGMETSVDRLQRLEPPPVEERGRLHWPFADRLHWLHPLVVEEENNEATLSELTARRAVQSPDISPV